MYRLTRSIDGGGSAIDYDLDGVGNRTSVTGGRDPGPYFLDPNIPPADLQCNQYTTTPRGGRLYDDNGNLLSSGGDLSGLQYDYLDRMISATDAFGNVHTYRYDALGRRVEQQNTTSGVTSRYYYDGLHVIEERDAGAGFPILVEWVNVNVPLTVISSEEKLLTTIEGEVGVAVIEGERCMALVTAVRFESDECGWRVSFVAYVRRDIE